MTHANPTADLATLSIDSLVWMASAQPVLDEAIRARGLGMPQERLVRAGVRALIDAARYYDPATHGRFSTHVRDRVRAALHEQFGLG